MASGIPRDSSLPEWLGALLQLASPALPTGAFSYSQGLEQACELGLVTDEASALAWIDAQWSFAFHPRELPAFAQAWRAIDAGDAGALAAASEDFIASRDAAEARAETMQVGGALLRWLDTMHGGEIHAALAHAALERAAGDRLAAPVAYALCGHAQRLPMHAASFGYAYAWLEAQVQAAVKLVPLGQSAGQRMLLALRPRLSDPVPEEAWSFAPVAAICAMRHERQYTRLFRS